MAEWPPAIKGRVPARGFYAAGASEELELELLVDAYSLSELEILVG
jgi:hypothetical protein